MKPMQVYLDEDTYKSLQKFAIDSDETVSSIIRVMVRKYLKQRGRLNV